ncbi:MAG: flagellar FliJ family protein [Candidatus Kapabacteria bacterium]|nr:flagellar FliJ family protein [Candidatus Kapabacteria bacterium]
MAKKFNFRLEKVLNLKSQKVLELKEALNLVVVSRLAKEKEIDKNQNYLNNLLYSNKGVLPASSLQTSWSHKTYIQDTIKKLRMERDQLIEIENLRRQKLVEAMKEEKILLKLKDKKQLQHKEELSKEEIKILDEIANIKYINNSDSKLQ